MDSPFFVAPRKKTCCRWAFRGGLSFALLAVILIGLLRTQSTAALLFEESFDYSSDQSISGLNGGSGFLVGSNGVWNRSSPPYPDRITNGGLSFSNLAASGNAVLSHVAGGDDDSHQSIRRFNPVALSSGVSLWFSFLMKLDSIPSGRSVSDFEGYVSLFDPSSNNSIMIGLSRRSSNIGIGTNVSNKTTVASEGTITIGKTYFVVVHIEPGQPITLYIDPPPGVDLPAESYQSATASFTLPSQFSRVGVFSTGADAEWIFDELRLGTSYLDVAPIPEPSESFLMVFGAVTLLLSKYRRQILLRRELMAKL